MNKPNLLQTLYASAERETQEELTRQKAIFSELHSARELLNLIPNIIVVLNRHRQVIFANRALWAYLGWSDDVSPIGKRPGEFLGCIHASETEGGCGTTMFCKTCGAVNSILQAQNGFGSIQECRIIRALSETPEAFDLKVHASPFQLDKEEFTEFVIEDISHQNRRSALEYIFFHDVLNTASGILGFSKLLTDIKNPENVAEFGSLLHKLSVRLVEEIQAQRELLSAECGDLVPKCEPIASIALINEVISLYQDHTSGIDRNLKLEAGAQNITFNSDPVLVRRVLGNMVKNAFEASVTGGTVTIGCYIDRETIQFLVHNAGVMKPEVQLQVFQRSFSTKGAGRGLGTYGMKLLTEKYLNGSVSFTSETDSGTVFTASFPCH